MISKIPLIPYFKTSRYRVETMVELSNVKKKELVADLGSGDGRISIAFGEKEANVEGFELDPNLVRISNILISKKNLQQNIIIHQTNFWSVDLSRFDIVCIYPMPDIMLELEKKLQSELKVGSRVLLNYYPFPNWEYVENKDNIYLYKKLSA